MHNAPIRNDLFDGTLNGYQQAAQTTAIYPGKGTALGLIYVALKGCGEAGEFAEHVGKAMRDDELVDDFNVHAQHNRTLLPERFEALIKEIGDELWYLAAKCEELGITLDYAARVSLNKLKDRQNRGNMVANAR